MPRPSFTFDLNQIPRDIWGMMKLTYVMWTTPKEAPPSIRDVSMAFISISNKHQEPVGVFVPYLYALAEAKGLKAQLEEKEWDLAHATMDEAERVALKRQQPFYNELYYGNHNPRSAFRLALLPIPYDDDLSAIQNPVQRAQKIEAAQKAARKIGKVAEAQIQFRKLKGLSSPVTKYKYQIAPDYLEKLHEIKFTASNPRAIKINVINPGDITSPIERALHYSAQRLAFFATFAFAFASAGLGAPWIIALSALGSVAAKWCLSEFGMYDVAETILREKEWLQSSEFRDGHKFSLKKMLKTFALTGALLGFAGIGNAISGTFMSVMSMATPSLFGVTAPFAFLQQVLAGSLAATTGIGLLAGGVVSVSFFWGLGIYDNQINFSNEKAGNYPALKPETPQDHIARLQAKIDALRSGLPQDRNDDTVVMRRPNQQQGGNTVPPAHLDHLAAFQRDAVRRRQQQQQQQTPDRPQQRGGAGNNNNNNNADAEGRGRRLGFGSAE